MATLSLYGMALAQEGLHHPYSYRVPDSVPYGVRSNDSKLLSRNSLGPLAFQRIPFYNKE